MIKKTNRITVCLLIVFTMLSSSAFATPVKSKFKDVNEDKVSWYKEDLAKAVERGLVKGKSETKYDPTAQVTVAEFVAAVVRLTNVKSYLDIKNGMWYDEAMEAALRHNYLESTDFRLYIDSSPSTKKDRAINYDRVANKPITREDATAILTMAITDMYPKYWVNSNDVKPIENNIYEYDTKEVKQKNLDIFGCEYSIQSLEGSVQYAINKGLVQGVGTKDGMILFKPKDKIDRRQLAVILNNAYDYIQANGLADRDTIITSDENFSLGTLDMSKIRESWGKIEFNDYECEYNY